MKAKSGIIGAMGLALALVALTGGAAMATSLFEDEFDIFDFDCGLPSDSQWQCLSMIPYAPPDTLEATTMDGRSVLHMGSVLDLGSAQDSGKGDEFTAIMIAQPFDFGPSQGGGTIEIDFKILAPAPARDQEDIPFGVVLINDRLDFLGFALIRESSGHSPIALDGRRQLRDLWTYLRR